MKESAEIAMARMRDLLQDNFSMPLNMINKVKREVSRNPVVSRKRINTTRRIPIVKGRPHRVPCQRVDTFIRPTGLRRNDWKRMIRAMRQMKKPARRERKPEPGFRKVPTPSWTDPKMLPSPTASQKRPPILSAGMEFTLLEGRRDFPSYFRVLMPSSFIT
jgi:hypothetical protein